MIIASSACLLLIHCLIHLYDHPYDHILYLSRYQKDRYHDSLSSKLFMLSNQHWYVTGISCSRGGRCELSQNIFSRMWYFFDNDTKYKVCSSEHLRTTNQTVNTNGPNLQATPSNHRGIQVTLPRDLNTQQTIVIPPNKWPPWGYKITHIKSSNPQVFKIIHN